MDTALYGIPVLGILFQIGGYLIAVLPTAAPTILAAATPLGFGALCGVACERSGVVNIGIEGTMLTAAFTGWIVAIASVGILGKMDPGPLGITPALLIGLVAAILSAVGVSLLHAWLSISLRVDQIISGTIINIAAGGFTGYLYRLIVIPDPRMGAGNFGTLSTPDGITSIPPVEDPNGYAHLFNLPLFDMANPDGRPVAYLRSLRYTVGNYVTQAQAMALREE